MASPDAVLDRHDLCAPLLSRRPKWVATRGKIGNLPHSPNGRAFLGCPLREGPIHAVAIGAWLWSSAVMLARRRKRAFDSAGPAFRWRDAYRAARLLALAAKSRRKRSPAHPRTLYDTGASCDR